MRQKTRIVKTTILILLSLIVLSISAHSKGVFLTMRAKYFNPKEQYFKDIYGKGTMFGGEVDIPVWKWISIWTGGDYLSNKGKLTYSGESTEIQIIPLYCGVKFRWPKWTIKPYIALGLGYFFYKETNVIGTIDDKDIGYIGQTGAMIEFKEGFFIDINVAYSSCSVKPADIKANLGGFQAGIGIGYKY